MITNTVVIAGCVAGIGGEVGDSASCVGVGLAIGVARSVAGCADGVSNEACDVHAHSKLDKATSSILRIWNDFIEAP
jgi:hypothetical protein